MITIDGGTGEVILGPVDLVPPQINQNFELLLGWADDIRRLKVRANADTPADAAKAREFGAQGIGLCRTEHMFMVEDRLPLVREMIMASGEDERREALARLLPLQQEDFEGIFEAMAGLPVTIRLLDPPLHEFLPSLEEAESPEMARRIRTLREANPMLGTRGCRLGLLFPEIYEMQVRAIIRAAAAVEGRTGDAPLVEIMHPLVGFAEELRRLRELTVRTADEEGDGAYLCGTMIELPRACIRADEIAEHADFFSFGTNDLTQTTLGFSRDDAEGKFLTHYLDDGILRQNPFETLDQSGVGELMELAVERARSVKPDLKMGICGEHGGDPASVAFCHRLGLDYVSCSPYRVPLARLAAAQAALAESGVGAVPVRRLVSRAAGCSACRPRGTSACSRGRRSSRTLAAVVDRSSRPAGGWTTKLAIFWTKSRVVDSCAEAPLADRVRLVRVARGRGRDSPPIRRRARSRRGRSRRRRRSCRPGSTRRRCWP